jgi:hypothetical protein
MTNIIEKKVYADGESYYFNTETMGRYGDIMGGLAWPETREGFLVIAGVDLFENTELETRPIRVLAGVMESNIKIFLKYALELQKKFSPFMETIRVYGDTTSASMMELLDQFNKDRRQRGLDPFYLTEAPQLKSPKKIEFYAQLIRTYTQPGRKILHFCDTTLPSYLAGLPPEEISHGVLKHPPIAALAYAMAALSTWRPRKGEKRVGKEETEVSTKYEPILTGKAIRDPLWRPPEISEPPK